MQLVPKGKPHIELWAVAIGDNLIRAGQIIHRRFAVVANDAAADALAIRLDGWRGGTEQFILWGDRVNFSQRQMERAGIVRRMAYEKYMGVLKASGVLIVYPRSGAYWAYGWNRRKLAVMIRRRLIELPYPIDEDAPPLFVGRVADAQLAQHTQLTQVSAVWAKSGPKPPELK